MIEQNFIGLIKLFLVILDRGGGHLSYSRVNTVNVTQRLNTIKKQYSITVFAECNC